MQCLAAVERAPRPPEAPAAAAVIDPVPREARPEAANPAQNPWNAGPTIVIMKTTIGGRIPSGEGLPRVVSLMIPPNHRSGRSTEVEDRLTTNSKVTPRL